MPKILLATQGAEHGSGHDPRTDHLRPVIEFLLAQGNTPGPGGELHYAFTEPIDAAQLREHFAFPATIVLDDAGTIRDGANRVDIYHQQPAKRFSFEGQQTGS